MLGPVFPVYPFKRADLEALLDHVKKCRALWSPQTGADGHCRLLPLSDDPYPSLAVTTFLPLKKLLLPPREEVWTYSAGRFVAPRVDESFAVVGLPLCDLQAVWYLDQVFADDEPYQARRAQFLLVGMACQAGPECRCDGQLMPLAGDLYFAQEWAWALSPLGEALLHEQGSRASREMPLPWPEGVSERRPELALERFASETDAMLWVEEARRCLSCGACSAVCPTCYCFDMLDESELNGCVTRNRVWDNCFFAEHGKVAGNYDFRPGRANRLRFRMEHKFFGFGELRGQNSCVGCGRCRKACPVDIDLDRIAEQLNGEGGS